MARLNVFPGRAHLGAKQSGVINIPDKLTGYRIEFERDQWPDGAAVEFYAEWSVDGGPWQRGGMAKATGGVMKNIGPDGHDWGDSQMSGFSGQFPKGVNRRVRLNYMSNVRVNGAFEIETF